MLEGLSRVIVFGNWSPSVYAKAYFPWFELISTVLLSSTVKVSGCSGNVFNGDDVIYTIAKRNKSQAKDKSDAVVGTDMTNQGVVEALNKIGVEFFRAKVGDKYISRELVSRDLNLGGETSGHIIQREFS